MNLSVEADDSINDANNSINDTDNSTNDTDLANFKERWSQPTANSVQEITIQHLETDDTSSLFQSNNSQDENTIYKNNNQVQNHAAIMNDFQKIY